MIQKMNQKDQQVMNDLHFSDASVEVRSGGDGGPVCVFGYAALFNTRSREMRTYGGKRFVEEILPGAFTKTDFGDTECRFSHQLFLAASPTLKLGVDERGLWYEYEHDPGDPDHVAVLRKIERRDVKGSSFMFDHPDEEDQIVTKEGGVILRQIKRIKKVFDVGPVVTPAYRATTAFARSLDAQQDAPDAAIDANTAHSSDEPGPTPEPVETEEQKAARALLEARRLDMRRTLI